jgi:catechol 2,3-dioxygenase-like lactoylglutathione lyase family enzyme
MTPGIHHVALRVRDCDVSREFYEKAFGLTTIKRVDDAGILRAVWLRAGSAVLMLERSIRGNGPEAGSGHVLIFEGTSLEGAEKRLREADVVIVDRTPSTLYVTDPDGHRAGVSIHRFSL